MNTRSLRTRLAVLYVVSVMGISLGAAGIHWLAVRSALHAALDEGLRYRLVGLQQYLDYVQADDPDDLADELEAVLRMGELYQVFDAEGRLLAQSAWLEGRGPQAPPGRGGGPDVHYAAAGDDAFPLRVAWQRVTIGGQPLTLVAVDPQRKYAGVIDAVTTVLLISVPTILLAAAAGGVWFGRRALTPVAHITEAARAIDERRLSARLAVPASGDELQVLSETLNAMLARIEDAFQRIRQFTEDASHELRAPLTLIHTAAESSLRRPRSREVLEENAGRILREAQRTTTLIDDLLLLARGDAQPVDAWRRLDARALVRDVAEQAAALGAAKSLRVELDLPAEDLPVLADGASLRRLLLILADNAVKFTPSGGRINLSASGDASSVQVTVRDTGPGVAAHDLPFVFDRFWRADKARTRDAGGAGLGLAIARQIAQRHHGALEVESAPGRGSAFTVTLPRGDA